jgi:hypothetical protein
MDLNMRLIYCQPACFCGWSVHFSNKIALNLTMYAFDTYHNLFAGSTLLLTYRERNKK